MVVATDGAIEVCIDRFEAPNVEGAEPLAMQTATDGEQWCGERGKRLCSDVEWMAACKGSEGHSYPYGDSWEAHRCNDDKIWKSPSWGTLGTWPSAEALAEAERLYQADPSGSRTGCLSDAGAFDLTGNVAEWVVRTIDNANNYDHVMKGCYWAGCYGGSHPSCGFVNPAHPGGFRTYEAGFRCCRAVGVLAR
jgi:formylglycine-generating enzyme required for sulfatase activity